jgi:hypothetical protein
MEYFETFVNLLGVAGTKNFYYILPDALKHLFHSLQNAAYFIV